ncbi:MAG: type II toxin-antitoxin system VapC family toxin [Candidatus Bathyarchaeia archaeon]
MGENHKGEQGGRLKLFDSSAIIVLCGEKKLDKLLDGWTINLAYYELGNAVWKQVNVYKKMTTSEARKVLDSIAEAFRRLKKPKDEDTLETLKIATEENLTFYDASYIQAATKKGFVLVTDDDKLLKIAKKYTEAITSQQL